MTACTGQPVSWLRLEQHALAADPAVARHLEECAACRGCFAAIAADGGRALPPLGDVALAAAARRRHRRRAGFLGTATALAAAAVVLLVVLGRGREDAPGIKGTGELVIRLVRERAGEVAMDPATWRPGDRFKVLVTCARRGEVEVTVTVEQAGEVFTPLAPARIRCGNQVALPGAFSLDGDQPATVCARLPGEAACAPLAAGP
ncbi:MAG TPA: hypothetical protein VFU21_29605 [Kofleriaceae bacterium]|nr:hypothetical protein [Kofleriaceae bacterium]